MHDIDRTLQEYEFDDRMEIESDLEFNDEFASLIEPETDFELDGQQMESPFSEEEEIALADELLSISDEQELDQFLGSLFKKVARGARSLFKSPVLRKIGGFLKGVAKKALPIAGRVVGGVFGGPGGSAIGGKLGDFASNMFEMEMEGMSPEDRDFEVARRYVRFAGSTLQNASKLANQLPPTQAYRQSIQNAAKIHAPGLLRNTPGGAMNSRTGTGRWIRRGRHLIVLNCYRQG